MANLMFSLRGDSVNARYAPGGATAQNQGGVVVQVPATGTGIIGTGYLDFFQGAAGYFGLGFPALGNIGTSNKVSILIRVAFKGSVAGYQPLVSIGDQSQLGNAQFQYTAGALQVYMSSYTNTTYANNNEAFTPVIGQFYDVFYSCDMSSTTGIISVFVDGVLLGSSLCGAAPRPWPNPRSLNSFSILVGMSGAYTQAMYINEVVIWDGIQDPTSVQLNSGIGPLNGQSRTSYVQAAAFDGSIYTDPNFINVANGVNYTFAGVPKTGTLNSVTNVLSSATLTGQSLNATLIQT
jgi:hypothetical protein